MTSHTDVMSYLTSKHESERLLAIHFALYAAGQVKRAIYQDEPEGVAEGIADHAAIQLAVACRDNPTARDLFAATLEDGPELLRDAFAREVSE